MASPPASDPPSPSTSRSDVSILSGGGGSGSAKKEGGTSRGGGAAASGGNRVSFADSVDVRPFRPSDSAAATFTATFASIAAATAGGSRRGPSSVQPTALPSTATAPSASSLSRKRDRDGRDAGPPADVISPCPSTTTSAATATATTATSTAAATKSSHHHHTTKKQGRPGPIFDKDGFTPAGKKGTATGHAPPPKPVTSSSASDGWTANGLQEYREVIPEDRTAEEAHITVATDMSLADLTDGAMMAGPSDVTAAPAPSDLESFMHLVQTVVLPIAMTQLQQHHHKQQRCQKQPEEEYPPLPEPVSSSDSGSGGHWDNGGKARGGGKSILSATSDCILGTARSGKSSKRRTANPAG